MRHVGAVVCVCAGVNAQPYDKLVTQWSRHFSSTSDRYAYSVAQLQAGGYVIAGSQARDSNGLDVFIARLDSAGILKSMKTYDGVDDDEAHAVIQTRDGGFAVAGYSRSNERGDADIMLLKVDAGLNLQYRRLFGGSQDDMAVAIAQLPDGGYALAGFTGVSPENRDDAFIRTDAYGNVMWQKSFWASPGNDEITAVALTADGGAVIAGYSDGVGATARACLTKVNSSAIPQWTYYHDAGEGAASRAYSVVVEGTSYRVTGGMNPGPNGGWDAMTFAVNASGALMAPASVRGGRCNDINYEIVKARDGKLYTAGYTESWGPSNARAFLEALSPALTSLYVTSLQGEIFPQGSHIAPTSDSGLVVVFNTLPDAGDREVVVRKYGYGNQAVSGVSYVYQQWFTCLESLESAGFSWPGPGTTSWKYDEEAQAMVTAAQRGYSLGQLPCIYTPVFNAERCTAIVVVEWKVKLPSPSWLQWRAMNRLAVSLCSEAGVPLYTLVWRPNRAQHGLASHDLILLLGGEDDNQHVAAARTKTTTPVGPDAKWLQFRMELHPDGAIKVLYDPRDGKGLRTFLSAHSTTHNRFERLLFVARNAAVLSSVNYTTLVDDIDIRTARR